MPTTIASQGAVPFPVHPELTAIAQHYIEQEGSFIADRVLPPAPQLGQAKFEYTRYLKADAFVVPDPTLGRKSEPQEVEISGEKVTDSTQDYGYRDLIPQSDVDAAMSSGGDSSMSQWRDPRTTAVIYMTHLLRLAREKRVADLVFATSSYGGDYRKTLQSSARWTQDDADPVGDLDAALNAPIIRPNIVVFGQEAWTAFRKHSKVIDAIYHGGSSAGLARRRDVAELLEVDELLVGHSRIATSKEGQALALGRVWGKGCAVIYRGAFAVGGGQPGGDAGSEGRGRLMSDMKRPTFGFTAPYVPVTVRQRFDEGRGVKGVHDVTVIESCREVICGGEGMGYLLSGVVG